MLCGLTIAETKYHMNREKVDRLYKFPVTIFYMSLKI